MTVREWRTWELSVTVPDNFQQKAQLDAQCTSSNGGPLKSHTDNVVSRQLTWAGEESSCRSQPERIWALSRVRCLGSIILDRTTVQRARNTQWCSRRTEDSESPWKTPLPLENKALRAFLMFSSIHFELEREVDHHAPRHLADWEINVVYLDGGPICMHRWRNNCFTFLCTEYKAPWCGEWTHRCNLVSAVGEIGG